MDHNLNQQQLDKAFVELYSILLSIKTPILTSMEEAKQLAQAIFSSYSKDGFEYYYNLCLLSETHLWFDIKQEYLSLSSELCKVDLTFVFDLAIKAGVDEASSILESITYELTFEEEVYEDLPQILQDHIAFGDNRIEKDLLLIGGLTSLSAIFPNVLGYYMGTPIYPNLFLFITAPASAGKGILKYCQTVLDPVNQSLREITAKEREHAKLSGSSTKGSRGSSKPDIRIPERMLFIPANNSSSGFVELLYVNKGQGLIFETEADTLTEILKSDYGNYSSHLRSAWSHEPVKFYRKSEDQLVEINEPKLSVLLTGTPRQLTRLIPDSENGLFSRFLYYSFPLSLKWKNPFEESQPGSIRKHYQDLALRIKDFHQKFETLGEVQFKFRPNQVEEFNAFFSSAQGRYVDIYGDEIVSAFRRVATSCFKIAMLLSVLRTYDKGFPGSQLLCEDRDFKTAMSLSSKLLNHAAETHGKLKKDGEKATMTTSSKVLEVINTLPGEFTWKQFSGVCKKLGLNTRTVERHLTNLTRTGYLERPAKGIYRRAGRQETVIS